MSARVYFMKDVSIMSPQDEQWIRTSLLCLYPTNVKKAEPIGPKVFTCPREGLWMFEFSKEREKEKKRGDLQKLKEKRQIEHR